MVILLMICVLGMVVTLGTDLLNVVAAVTCERANRDGGDEFCLYRGCCCS